MKQVECLTTHLYDEQERYVGSATTAVLAPSNLWERVRGEWQRAPYWVQTTLSDGITDDGILQRVRSLDEARREHSARAWNYRLHLLGEA